MSFITRLIFDKEYSIKSVPRDNIYAGQLVEPLTPKVIITDIDGNEKSLEDLKAEGISNFSVSAALLYRKILFSINNNGLADDMLYTSPNYYITGIDSEIKNNSKLIIDKYVKLENLLLYFNFPEQLKERDVLKLYKLFLKDDKFLYKNCELFGMSKCEAGWCTNGKEHPLALDDLGNLSSISHLSKKPHENERQRVLIRSRV